MAGRLIKHLCQSIKNQVMIRKFLKHFALIAVSLPGFFFFNLLLLTINSRLLFKIYSSYSTGGFLGTELFTDFCESVAIRMVAIGVLILERHEVLEMTGAIDSHQNHDPLTIHSQPYGMFYLCAGLLMECIIQQIKSPVGLFESSFQHECMIFIVIVFTVISCVVSATFASELIGFIFKKRKTTHSVEG